METICLNLTPTGARPVCHVSQYDVGRVIRVMLLDDSIPYIIQNGDTLIINILKPNGENVSESIEIIEGNTYADMITVEGMCDVSGRNICELRLQNGDKDIGTLNFYIDVEEYIGNGGSPTPPIPGVPDYFLTITLGTKFVETDINYIVEVDIV